VNRLDLIIDNIMYARIIKESAHQDELLDEALAAARELKALEPVAIVDHSHPFSDDSFYMIANYERSFPSGTKLYALDEVTK